MATGLDELLSGPERQARSIAELYDELEGTLARAFPRSRALWVRGEVHSWSDRTGHCYLDLIDPESTKSRGRQAPVLKVKCWKTSWAPIRAALRREGIELEPGMVVTLRGTLDFYRPRAEIGFLMAELDVTALLGRLAAQRAALLRALEAEGLLDRNRSLVLADVPVRVGLVASPGSEGYRDFLGQLEGSGFAFSVQVAKAAVQGGGAPAAVARSVAGLARAGCDLIVVVRGGGSKADLAAFDAEPVARAIATSPVPVWTGIGHTGDESVADIVAHRAFVTPTECGRELAQLVAGWWEDQVGRPALAVLRRATEVVAAVEHRDAVARQRLAANAQGLLRWHGERLASRVATLAGRGPDAIDRAEDLLEARAKRLGPSALGHLDRSEDRLGGWRRLLAAYDVERQLERGYSLTTDAQGRVVRSVTGLAPGDVLTTRLADGSTRSVVETVERATASNDNDRGDAPGRDQSHDHDG